MLNVTELTDKKQTGQEMYNLVNRFSGDINSFNINGIPLSSIPLKTYYEIVKNIPFKADKTGIEIVTRPYHLFASPYTGWDCKKKGIAIASWLKENHIPYKFVAVSRQPNREIHHVIVEASNGGQWLEIDATYPENYIGQVQNWTAKEDLPANFSGTLSGAAKLVSMYGNSPEAEQAEFIRAAVTYSPETMGNPAIVVPIVTAIIGLVSTITATVVNRISSKRQQDRAYKRQLELQTMQTAELKQQYEQQQEQAKTGADQTKNIFQKWLIPAAAAVGLIALS